MFPFDLVQDSYLNGGEYGWTRAQIPRVVNVLIARRMEVLGGEASWVHRQLSVMIPQRDREVPFVHTWETHRRCDEPWDVFIQRAAAETLQMVQDWPRPDDLPGRILFNLTWVSEETIRFSRLLKPGLFEGAALVSRVRWC